MERIDNIMGTATLNISIFQSVPDAGKETIACGGEAHP